MSAIKNLKGLAFLLAVAAPLFLMAGLASAQDTTVSVTTGGAAPAPAPVPVPVPVTETGTTTPQPGELPPLPAASSSGKSNFESGGNFEVVEHPEYMTFEQQQAYYKFQQWSESWKDGKYVPPPKGVMTKGGTYYNSVYAFSHIAAGRTYYLESHYPEKKKPATIKVGKTVDGTPLYDVSAFGNFHYYQRIR